MPIDWDKVDEITLALLEGVERSRTLFTRHFAIDEDAK